MKSSVTIVVAALLLAGCGSSERVVYVENPKPDPTLEIKEKLLALQGELSSLIANDWTTCSGNDLSTAAKNVCKIAQAATGEAKAAMEGAIADLASQIQSRINDGAADFKTMSSIWNKLYGVDFPETTGASLPTEAECKNFNGNASTFSCIQVQGSKIDTLNNSVNTINSSVNTISSSVTAINNTIDTINSSITSINSTISILTGTVNGAMIPVTIGNENLLAGPFYEQVVRLGDGSRINGYVDGLGSSINVGTNPISTNGSTTITITTSANHNLVAGNFVRIQGCTSGRGLTSADLNGTFEVANGSGITFTIVLSSTATSTGTIGGSTCVFKKFTGAGFTTIWTNSSGSDGITRRTTGGSKAYNFAICKTSSNEGKICYSKTNNNALIGDFSTVFGANCVSSGDIVCK